MKLGKPVLEQVERQKLYKAKHNLHKYIIHLYNANVKVKQKNLFQRKLFIFYELFKQKILKVRKYCLNFLYLEALSNMTG